MIIDKTIFGVCIALGVLMLIHCFLIFVCRVYEDIGEEEFIRRYGFPARERRVQEPVYFDAEILTEKSAESFGQAGEK